MRQSVYISLGSNMGDREHYLAEALHLLAAEAGRVVGLSDIYETEPWGCGDEHGAYLNQVLCLDTGLTLFALLELCLSIEERLGRLRSQEDGYMPRTIDIDLLMTPRAIINTAALTLPHPRLHLRKFVLTPLAALAPNLVHPILGKPIAELLTDCQDFTLVKAYAQPTEQLQ